MDWKNTKKEEEVKEMTFDPNTMWNVESPTRRMDDRFRILADNDATKKTNDLKSLTNRQRREDGRNLDLSEGR